jgi:hypothetical protein
VRYASGRTLREEGEVVAGADDAAKDQKKGGEKELEVDKAGKNGGFDEESRKGRKTHKGEEN